MVCWAELVEMVADMTSDLKGRAMEAVAEAFAQVKCVPTPAESLLWVDQIELSGPQSVLAFMHFWMSGRGQDGYLRAPRVADFEAFMSPQLMDAAAALGVVRRMVASVGPYRVPALSDGASAEVCAVISALGGWVKVCETLPDSSQEHSSRVFERSFQSAWAQVKIQCARGLVAAQPLVAIGHSPVPAVSAAQAALSMAREVV